jgi:uncharacterized protein (TIGR00251 family)
MIELAPSGVLIDIRVIPRAARSEIAGTRGGALIVRLNAPPVDDAANAELIRVLAAALEVPKRAITIVAGEHSRAKRVQVAGLDVQTAEARLHG